MKTAQRYTKKRSLAYKLSLFILTSTTAIFLSVFVYNYQYSKGAVLKNVELSAKNLTSSTVNRIESVLRSTQKAPLFLPAYLEKNVFTKEVLLQLIGDLVRNNEEVYGSTVAFEPFAYDPAVRAYAPYYYKSNGELNLIYLGMETYDYYAMDWYQIPKLLDRPVWSEPYFDEGAGNIIMSTYSMPFYRNENGNRTFWGIVTVDLSLEWLVDLVSSISIYESGYAFLLSQNGFFVTHPNKSYIMRESIFSIAEAVNNLKIRKIGHDMVEGKEGFVPYFSSYLNKQSWMYYAGLPVTHWSVGVVFPEDEFLADIRAMNHRVLAIGITGFILLFIVIVLISGSITKPIRTLAETTAAIAKGNLDIEMPKVHSNDEIGELSRSFEDMRDALKEYISNLTETTKAKERIESELKIAHNIQMNFLPKHFPPFPDKVEFDIYAMLEPAKEVGGDLYDFFLLNDEHLFFSIGDVADKGVPAALFMAVTKTLMKGIAEQGIDPAEILMKVNNELAQDNESSMFVTVFCGILNLKTGELIFSNAAHNQPLLIRKGKKVEWLELPDGFLLGPMEGTVYKTKRLIFQPGDMLLTYTDGVNEAMNQEKQMYSNERLLATVETNKNASADALVKKMMHSVHEFAAGEPQSDDITLLAMRFNGPS
ncbi:MAG: HAMP domain-containing protein [Candidatus Omnitrophota bacterium]|jgi:sigma-B regulation protein RsbU (phosphoserine phosphatase)|nr:MAG: HAMP domain-containing protein [Candidatus Omnitrophota bacterium]